MTAREKSEGCPAPVCSRCQLPAWTHELWPCLPAHMGRYADDDELRRDVVLRELNQGALAGMSSTVTEQAVDLVLAVLNRYDSWKASQGAPDLPEQIKQALSDAGAYCGGCDFEPGGRGCPDCEHCLTRYADAVMRLVAVPAIEPEGGVLEQPPTAAEVHATTLSEPERAMLRHALELAADAMANCPDEYNDDDSAALKSLRRMAAEGGEPA